MNRITLMAFLAIFLTLNGFSQSTTYEYYYNDSGQRIKRKIVGSSFRLAEDSNEESGLELEKLSLGIEVYPNPTEDYFIIESLKEEQDGTYDLFDTTGRRLLNGKFEFGSTNVNVEALPNGLYLLKLNSNDKIKSIKLTIK